MENKINLLKELVNKEKELYGEDDSSFITDQVEKMIEYRNIRTEQAWFSKATDGMTQRKIAIELVRLDHLRREKHNSSLRSINIINRFCSKTGLQFLYEGETLTNEQINEHDINSLDIRKEVTDFMLELVYNIQQNVTKAYEEPNSFIKGLKSKIEQTDREYGVEESLKEDDGDIEFKDFR